MKIDLTTILCFILNEEMHPDSCGIYWSGDRVNILLLETCSATPGEKHLRNNFLVHVQGILMRDICVFGKLAKILTNWKQRTKATTLNEICVLC